MIQIANPALTVAGAIKSLAVPQFEFVVTHGQIAQSFDDLGAIVYDQPAGWSSLVARWAHNPKVGGSNPPPATIYGFEGLPA
jgi:hypothetical protein